MKIGIDLGRTIISDSGDKPPFPDALRVIRRMTVHHDVYVVSRVNSEQRARAMVWQDKHRFFETTGVNPDHLFYCWERRDKSYFAKAIGIQVFIDDRPNVLSYMEPDIKKLLFNPSDRDLETFGKDIKAHDMSIVWNWIEIEKMILP